MSVRRACHLAAVLVRDLRHGSDLDQVLLVREADRHRRRDGAEFLKLVLGDRTGGVPAMVWEDVAQAVHERDEYDVEAFNLVTLKDTMNKYAALTNDDFVIRMAAPEVAGVAKDLAGRAVVLKIDTERYPDLAARYRVQSIPNFVVIQDGRVVMQRAGLAPRAEMRDWISRISSSETSR